MLMTLLMCEFMESHVLILYLEKTIMDHVNDLFNYLLI